MTLPPRLQFSPRLIDDLTAKFRVSQSIDGRNVKSLLLLCNVDESADGLRILFCILWDHDDAAKQVASLIEPVLVRRRLVVPLEVIVQGTIAVARRIHDGVLIEPAVMRELDALKLFACRFCRPFHGWWWLGLGRSHNLLTKPLHVITCRLAPCQAAMYCHYMGEEKTRVFQMRASDDWLKSIDDWRRTQPDIPGRAEAIRRLVEKALKREKR